MDPSVSCAPTQDPLVLKMFDFFSSQVMKMPVGQRDAYFQELVEEELKKQWGGSAQLFSLTESIPFSLKKVININQLKFPYVFNAADAAAPAM